MRHACRLSKPVVNAEGVSGFRRRGSGAQWTRRAFTLPESRLEELRRGFAVCGDFEVRFREPMPGDSRTDWIDRVFFLAAAQGISFWSQHKRLFGFDHEQALVCCLWWLKMEGDLNGVVFNARRVY